MGSITLQRVQDVSVNYNIDRNGNTILILMDPKTTFAVQTNHDGESTDAHSDHSMMVDHEQSDESEEEEHMDENASNTERGNNKETEGIPLSYRVSREYLTTASTYFANMAACSCCESTDPGQESGILLSSKEAWDPEALSILLQIMHYPTIEILQPIDLKLIGKMVVIADYLSCIQVLKDFLIRSHLDAIIIKRRVDSMSGSNGFGFALRDAIICTFISWKLLMPAEFGTATQTLMLKASHPIRNFGLSFNSVIMG